MISYKVGDMIKVISPHCCADPSRFCNAKITRIDELDSMRIEQGRNCAYVCRSCIELVKKGNLVKESNWNTHLVNKGYLKKGNIMPFTTNEPVEDEVVLKKYRVSFSEVHYWYVDVEAENEDVAEELANSGDYDRRGDDYDHYECEGVAEVV